MWNAQTGQELVTLSVHDGAGNSVAYSQDGKRILNAGGKIPRVHTTDMDELLQIAESCITR